MSYFEVSKITPLSELKLGDQIPESDYTQTVDGNLIQFKYIEQEEIIPMKVTPGIYTIGTKDNQITLLHTEFSKQEILEEFVTTETIEKEVDQFFGKLDIYRKYRKDETPRRALLLYGAAGCHAKGTEILMCDGSTKKVEEVVVGDLLMGPDSQPREVLNLVRGKDKMIKINPTKGEPFIVNENHMFHFAKCSFNKDLKKRENMTFKEYRSLSDYKKSELKLLRSAVEFSNKELPIDPYILGSWLGDGHSESTRITSMDFEILKAWENYSISLGLKFKFVANKGKASTYSITSGNGSKKGIPHALINSFQTNLRKLNLINNKHIPIQYLTSDRNQRLELLAGLLDTDGSLHHNGYDYISVRESLTDGIIFLARSLGLSAYKTITNKKCTNNGKINTYYRVNINGDTNIIPCKVPRKKAKLRTQKKSVLKTGFTFEELPEDNFYGFTLDKDHLYLTADFTIHHNCGKSTAIAKICEKYIAGGDTLVMIWPTDKYEAYHVKDLVKRFNYDGVQKLLFIIEDIGGVEMEEHRRQSDPALLSLLDNNEKTFTIPTFTIATTNFPEMFMENIANRPGRLDKKIEVKPPTVDQRIKLFQFFAQNEANEATLKLLENKKFDSFTPAHLKEAVIRAAIYDKSYDACLNEIADEIKLAKEGFKKRNNLGMGLMD